MWDGELWVFFIFQMAVAEVAIVELNVFPCHRKHNNDTYKYVTSYTQQFLILFMLLRFVCECNCANQAGCCCCHNSVAAVCFKLDTKNYSTAKGAVIIYKGMGGIRVSSVFSAQHLGVGQI